MRLTDSPMRKGKEKAAKKYTWRWVHTDQASDESTTLPELVEKLGQIKGKKEK